MEATDDYIKSAVENEISRMLAKNAANTGKSGASETVEGCEIKKEPEEVMEQDTSLQNSDHEMETTEDENNGNIQVENAGSNKYSVKVVTKYMCRYCARQFDSPDEMQEHIASHARGKSSYHACYVCGKTYSTPSKLQRHVRVHSGERPYACNICGRRFTRSDHVKQHLKVHMPQKQRNTCRLCGQKFLRRQTLHSHLQQTHGVSTVYTCHRCGEAFDEITKLHSHKNSHVSIYGKNDGPEVEGGMVIKQEAGENGENDTPIIGLAKFSLGPQPAPDDLVKQVNAAQMGGMSQNGYTYKPDGASDGYYTTETHRLAVAVQKSLPTHDKPQTTVYSYPMSSFDNQIPPEPEEDVAKDSNTVSDGMNMFILPSDIKKERESPDNSFNESNEEIYKSENCQTSYLDDIAAEEDEELNESNDTTDVPQKSSELMDDEKLVERAVQNLLTGPPGENKGIKMKLFGPASYKAAMRNKIAMKVPTPRLRQLQNTMVKASATGNVVTSTLSSEKGYTTLSKPAASNFSPYIVGGSSGSVTAKTQSPVQVTLSKEKEKKLSKCEHCCIWFEDYTMCLLHNSLHSADENDPFTCRKCLKKLGNRLEFTAHLVWHLEPNMQ